MYWNCNPYGRNIALYGKKNSDRKKKITCFFSSQEVGFILGRFSVCQLLLKKCLKSPAASLSFLDLIKLVQIKAPWINILAAKQYSNVKDLLSQWKGWKSKRA